MGRNTHLAAPSVKRRTMEQTSGARLRALLAGAEMVPVPGAHDALSVRLAKEAGFKAAFVSGAGLSMSRLGKPDLALCSVSEIVDAVRCFTEACDLPLIVDIDTGFGNALNAAHTARAMVRAGAAAIQMEDQAAPKRCGHLTGKDVIDPRLMAGKVRAAKDAIADGDCVVIARTDAIAVNGLRDAMDRAERYLDAGADALFLEAPASRVDMEVIAHRFSHRIPLVHNLVEGGHSPVSTASELAALGYRIALYPLIGLHAAIPAQRALLRHLAESGGTQGWSGPLADLTSLNNAVDLAEALQTGQRYAAT